MVVASLFLAKVLFTQTLMPKKAALFYWRGEKFGIGECIERSAKASAIKTAISPSALVGSLISLFWSFQMLRELCLVYNLRVGKMGTAMLLGRVFLSAYLSGRLDEWEDYSTETLEDIVGEQAAGKLLGFVGSRTVSRLANY